ncbi:hypothetical protein GJAV_G00131470 [Gymnothorax javanicus]|nr:hypothetical protein GJAV_G00131470 [Gymnothorax javanicus]
MFLAASLVDKQLCIWMNSKWCGVRGQMKSRLVIEQGKRPLLQSSIFVGQVSAMRKIDLYDVWNMDCK